MLHDFVERLNAVKSQQQLLYSDILAYIVEICAQFKCQRQNKHHTCGHRPARPIVEPELLFLSLLVRRKEAAPAQMNAAAALKVLFRLCTSSSPDPVNPLNDSPS